MDPVTLGFVVAGASTASMGISALGAIQQGNQASQADKYNSQIAANNALIAKRNSTFAAQEGEVNAGIEQQKTRANVGAIKASQAANGVNINEGSAADVRASATELGELDAINIRSGAARTAYGYQNQATSDMQQSELDRRKSKYDKQAGYMKAGTTLLGQGTSAYQSGAFDSWMGGNSMNAPETMGLFTE